ncbi:16S rRNA (uracil(1498)-N(3))-methyltransferase [Planktotalea sp.]|uniref:16S rRNA (uracil(1498)-N(3))-methyltransferase n=1 Tax=Planktotalea sp. TaxID=2029877 RepID=UPI0025E60871|nr:16S rRNA (uracil(1498)-N(3))-methyltransferase [Planktotalea sp.]
MNAKIRLFVDQPLAKGNRVSLTQPQAHYLFGVMRLAVGGAVSLFNGRDGEWRGEIVDAGKRKGTLECSEQTKPLQVPPDLWLCFAPIKKTRTDFIVEKAAEMGAAKIFPMQTEFTNSERVKQERLQAHAIEAAEQCGATYVPEVTELRKLSAMLDHWPKERQIMFCDEVELGVATSLATVARGPWAIFIGPEGGFSPVERKRLHAMPQAHVVSLGPRILRADTAAVAALTLWQAALGDWSQ